MIGKWVYRSGENAVRKSLNHLVESEITDRLIMRCGRQMRLVTKGGRMRETVRAHPMECYHCR